MIEMKISWNSFRHDSESRDSHITLCFFQHTDTYTHIHTLTKTMADIKINTMYIYICFQQTSGYGQRTSETSTTFKPDTNPDPYYFNVLHFTLQFRELPTDKSQLAVC